MKNMIRFMTIAMMLLVSTGFTACSDDDDDDKASWPTTGNVVFDEPYLGFGASISKVKGVMSGQRLHKEGSTSGSPYLFYYGTKSVESYSYFFDKSTKKYSFSVVDIPINSSNDPLLQQTTTVLTSNYTFQYYDEEEGDFYFLTKDQKTEVMFTINVDDNDNISLLIFFLPNSSSRSVRQMLPLSGKQPAWSAINKAKELITRH